MCKDARVKSAGAVDRVKRIFEGSRFEDAREKKEYNLRVEGWCKGKDRCPDLLNRLVPSRLVSIDCKWVLTVRIGVLIF